ncbi:hypothetical protein SY89_01258 [Halolamina pelagica]|uniref:Uncharacterized protein n=1 Tax=Halolamina pelagica TaxID=699431 RepID=A0A0N8HZV0_9EURY|nr:hypothetical protein [Halolamina pelagica]KPN30523.1 hypothetical protein SY89_01258 [Halolamina pelagica]
MATESSRGLSDHVRGVTVTTLACLAGVIAAVVTAIVFGTDPSAVSTTTPLAVVAAFVIAQYPILYALRVDVSAFGIKDNLYVAFMTFALWFLSNTIMLSTGVSF